MSHWPSSKAKKVFAAILRVGWSVKTQKGSSHKQMVHTEHGEATWAFHDGEEITENSSQVAMTCRRGRCA